MPEQEQKIRLEFNEVEPQKAEQLAGLIYSELLSEEYTGFWDLTEDAYQLIEYEGKSTRESEAKLGTIGMAIDDYLEGRDDVEVDREKGYRLTQ